MSKNNNNLQIDKERTTVSVSSNNFLILKKLGYKLESDSMDDTITKILEKIPGVYRIETENT